MGGEEEMASPEEHPISMTDESNGPEIDGDISLPTGSAFDEWTKELEKKMMSALDEYHLPAFLRVDKSEPPKICKLTAREEISEPRLERKGGLSRPSVVAIGPLHWQLKNTSISHKEKWRIVWLTNMLYNLKLEDCLTRMKSQVANAYKRYFNRDLSESSDFKDAKCFAEMLLLDSYFILFMLTIKMRKGVAHYTLRPVTPNELTGALTFSQDDDPFKFLDVLFHKDEIALDLLIFDNQIPFFVIDELFKELKLDKPLYEYALEFFETIHPRSARHCKDKNSLPEFLHLLHLFHWSRVPKDKYIKLASSLPQQIDSIEQPGHIQNAMEGRECVITIEKEEPDQQLDSIGWAGHIPNAMERRENTITIEKKEPQQLDSTDPEGHIPNAIELGESAIVFEKKTYGSSLDITFRRRRFKPIMGVLDVPLLHILDYSSLVFYNLIVFEIQSSTRGRCTMVFSALMRSLLRSEEDARLLRERGILVSLSMEDKQLIHLFERLSRFTENHQMPGDLSDICRQVQSHHKRRVSRLCGGIILQYFSKPVLTLSLVVAALLFVPTLLQTVYAMIYHG